MSQPKQVIDGIADAFARIKDVVAFSLGKETIDIRVDGKPQITTIDQLAKLSDDPAVKKQVAQEIGKLKIPPNSPQKDHAELRNIQRRMNLDEKSVTMDERQHMMTHAMLPATEQGFKGDYLECMIEINENAPEDSGLKEASRLRVVDYLQDSAVDFDRKMDAVNEPPVDMHDDEKLEILQSAHRDIDVSQNPEVLREQRVQVIGAMIGNQLHDSIAGKEFMEDVVKRQAADLGAAFDKTKLAGQEPPVVQQAQKTYLQETKEMIRQMKEVPQLQQVFTEQLVKNSSAFQDKNMQAEAAQPVAPAGRTGLALSFSESKSSITAGPEIIPVRKLGLENALRA